jgi:DNA-binding NtrC family response regulator
MANKILVVDDDSDTRRILRYVLSPVAAVLEASSGEEALVRIKAEKPRLVVLDLVMPGLGGLEVLEAGLKLFPSMTVVMLTGQSDVGVAKAALDKGARAYITKPIDPQRLREVVEDILGTESPDAGADRTKPWRVVG